MTIKTTCQACQHFTPCPVEHGGGDCAVWDKQIAQGAAAYLNADFYDKELGGDSFYSNCAFLADEVRDCKKFAGRYPFVLGD